jgi:hypothetical protein
VAAGGADEAENAPEVTLDLVVRDPEHSQPSTSKDAIAFLVVVTLVLVNGTIHLDDEASGVAVEVNDEPIDDLLSAKLKSEATVCAQSVPQGAFRRCHLAPELPRP